MDITDVTLRATIAQMDRDELMRFGRWARNIITAQEATCADLDRMRKRFVGKVPAIAEAIEGDYVWCLGSLTKVKAMSDMVDIELACRDIEKVA